jgi:NAD(P)-dependent dehydrogenase (short-subunit alcohol dehydrogenase family)
VAFVDVLDVEGEKLACDTGATFHHCDITDIAALKAVIEAIGDELGPIAVLVNNAANDERHSIDEVSVEYWDHSLDVNLRPHFFAAQAVRPQMKQLGYGSIINFSSTSWRFGAFNMAAYATAKSAIIGLTRALARGFGDDNIRVNAIEPGAVMTEKQRLMWYKTQESVDAIVQRQVIKRVLQGTDIARMVLFLAADDSAMITKQAITVDAGLAG